MVVEEVEEQTRGGEVVKSHEELVEEETGDEDLWRKV